MLKDNQVSMFMKLTSPTVWQEIPWDTFCVVLYYRLIDDTQWSATGVNEQLGGCGEYTKQGRPWMARPLKDCPCLCALFESQPV
jgi:hypothetical protein